MIRVFFQILLSAILAVAAYAWYGSVLPDSVAIIAAIVIGIAATYGLVMGQIRFRLLLVGGPVLVAWPAGAWAARWAGEALGHSPSWAVALGWSWWAPVLAWKVHHALAEKRDQARDIGGLILGAILLYIAAATAWNASLPGMAAAALGGSAVALTAHQQLLVPPECERALLAFALGGLGAALILGARAYFA